ncbi:myophilin-like [Clytia hemisphaerica]|uniref:Calponin-homology (CH) domain-containing protein n=1 Tax=Clytia hemisphaerica TaxID=252671 RepID=A0A7M5TRW4_9CNID|eukprot:TCONS_00008379-protein
MEHRHKGFGFTAETKRAIDSKYDIESEREALEWIDAVLGGNSGLKGVTGKDNVQQALANGIILCNLMNAINPGAVKKVHPENANKFKHQENVHNFLVGSEAYGCHRGDIFQTVDLTEDRNMPAVIKGIHTLGRTAQKNNFSGPTIGPKVSTPNKREFSEEQMRHGRVHGI